MTAYLVDTSVVNRDGRSPAVTEALERRAAQGPLFRCQIVVLEVLRGTAKHQYAAKRSALEAAYPELEMTKDVHERALAVQALLADSSKHQGVKIPHLLIAACAEVHGATVLHYHADYDTIAAVTSQPTVWVVPPGTADTAQLVN